MANTRRQRRGIPRHTQGVRPESPYWQDGFTFDGELRSRTLRNHLEQDKSGPSAATVRQTIQANVAALFTTLLSHSRFRDRETACWTAVGHDLGWSAHVCRTLARRYLAARREYLCTRWGQDAYSLPPDPVSARLCRLVDEYKDAAVAVTRASRSQADPGGLPATLRGVSTPSARSRSRSPARHRLGYRSRSPLRRPSPRMPLPQDVLARKDRSRSPSPEIKAETELHPLSMSRPPAAGQVLNTGRYAFGPRTEDAEKERYRSALSETAAAVSLGKARCEAVGFEPGTERKRRVDAVMDILSSAAQVLRQEARALRSG